MSRNIFNKQFKFKKNAMERDIGAYENASVSPLNYIGNTPLALIEQCQIDMTLIAS